MQQAVSLNLQNGAQDAGQERIDFTAETIRCRFERFAFGDHFQNGVLQLQHGC